MMKLKSRLNANTETEIVSNIKDYFISREYCCRDKNSIVYSPRGHRIEKLTKTYKTNDKLRQNNAFIHRDVGPRHFLLRNVNTLDEQVQYRKFCL